MIAKWTGSLIGLAFLGLTAAESAMADVEIPRYEVLSTAGNIEIREYQPMIIAEVHMKGERRDAMGDGFSLLADYIFGNNTVQQEIAMTAPVQQKQSAEIAMTAPVQQQMDDEGWQVSFVMPSEYTMDTLPQPVNERVEIRQVAAKQFVAIEFSGRNTSSNIREHQAELMAYIEANELVVVGSPVYAFYDAPWILPFFRRNEVMMELSTTVE
ncbi:SOUL heme-binding protein [Umboniibacter marinipuniceus]|uniref:SOUL heme-binding protein n=2 Tax=Umboniibacter marinipuniceus TaxID=569599 RepID=A0A3M0A8N1_9GAMM|nr:SOUL heme-binding protein [Umboniibacter marinipuniceus]